MFKRSYSRIAGILSNVYCSAANIVVSITTVLAIM